MVTEPAPGAEAPRTAWQAAWILVAEGKHVHYVAEGESRCLTGACSPYED